MSHIFACNKKLSDLAKNQNYFIKKINQITRISIKNKNMTILRYPLGS